MIEQETIKRARDLISLREPDEMDVMTTRFECLYAELSTVVLGFRSVKDRVPNLERMDKLSGALRYSILRMSDLVTRLDQLKWVTNKMSKDPDSQEFARFGIPGIKPMWSPFIGLGIKDFHIDVASLMDSVASVVIRVSDEIQNSDWSPGFAEVCQNGKYR